MPTVGPTSSKPRPSARSSRSNLGQRLQVLALVIGGLCLLIAAVLAGLSTLHTRDVRQNVLYLAGLQAAVGAGCLLLRFIFHTIPQWRNLHRSPSHQRRRDLATRRSSRASRNVLAPAPAPTPATVRDARGGGVLVLTLILLGLVAAMVVQSQALARGRLQREQQALRAAELRRAAGDAARAALQRLADDPDLQADHSNETWAVTEELVTPLGISTRTQTDDECRFFDLNNLRVPNQPGRRNADDIAMDILTLCGDFTPAARIASLVDFVDGDDAGLYESDAYARREPPYACPNRVLYGWGELPGAQGWSRDLFAPRRHARLPGSFDAALAECVTLLPLPRERPLPVNVNTASRETLVGVLGFDHEHLVNTIVTLRTLKPIRNFDALALLAEPEYFERVRPFLDVRSRVFRVEVRAYADGHAETLRVLAARGAEGRVDILQWIL